MIIYINSFVKKFVIHDTVFQNILWCVIIDVEVIKLNKYEITTMKKKRAIVESALSLFEKNGFVNVSIKEIAKNANVSPVSIYNYFGNKEALVFECAQILIGDIMHQASEILKLDISFIDRINKALHICTQSINVSISNHFTEMALSDPSLARLLTDSINLIKNDMYREYIETGKKEGVISSSLSTDIILVFLETLNTIECSEKDELKQIQHLFLYGMMGK